MSELKSQNIFFLTYRIVILCYQLRLGRIFVFNEDRHNLPDSLKV